METIAPNMIQELPWEPARQAVKDSVRFTDFAAFRAHLEETLPYNSAETRGRYTSTVIKYFFPGESLATLPRRAWQAYGDNALLEDLLRHQFLTQEPTVAAFLVNVVLPLAPGSVLAPGVIDEFIRKVDPKGRSKMTKRLALALRRMGFVTWERRQNVVTQVRPARTALLLLVHHLFAPTPRIVTLHDVLTAPFWKYLGFRAEEEVRSILHEANAHSLIAHYAIVEQLEQITTRYTLAQWLEQRLRL